MNYGSEFRNKISSLNQGEDEEVADGLSDNSSWFPKGGFPQLCEQGNILDMSKYIMKYVRGEHTQVNIDQNVHLEYGLSSTIDVRMVIQ